MTHTQMAPAYVAASNKKCPLTVSLAVLGEVDAPVFDALTTALAVEWPDESDVDPYDFDEITVEGGEIYFADEDRLEPATLGRDFYSKRLRLVCETCQPKGDDLERINPAVPWPCATARSILDPVCFQSSDAIPAADDTEVSS